MCLLVAVSIVNAHTRMLWPEWVSDGLDRLRRAQRAAALWNAYHSAGSSKLIRSTCMGLEFSHCSASWSYSSFNDFRHRLAAAARIRWPSTRRGFGVKPWCQSFDPLVILLNHSDCNGYIPHNACLALAHRLEEIMSSWAPDDFDRMNGMALVKGLRQAAISRQPLIFR